MLQQVEFCSVYALVLHQRASSQLHDGNFHFLTVSLTWDSLVVGGVVLRALRHSSVAVGDNIYVYGGILGGNPTNDLMVFNTGP